MNDYDGSNVSNATGYNEFRRAIETWLLESSCDYGLTTPLDDACPRNVTNENESAVAVGPIVCALEQTMDDRRNLSISIDTKTRLRRKLLSKSRDAATITLGMIRRRKLQKLSLWPECYLTGQIIGSELAPLGTHEIDISRIMASNHPYGVIRTPSFGPNALASFKYTTAFVVQIFPLEWFNSLLDDKMKSLIGDFTDLLCDRGVPEHEIPTLKENPSRFPVNFSYEVEYFRTLEKDWQYVKELLESVKESFAEGPEYKHPDFDEYGAGDWIPATSAFTINTVLLSSILTEVQGFISGIPC